MLFGGHQSHNAVTAPLRSGGGSGGRARPVAGTTARLADAAAMDANEVERRGAVVADAELNPATFAELAKGEVPLSVEGKVALKGMRYTEIEQWLTSIGERPSRAAQLFSWMYRRGKLVDGVQHMEDVAAAFREQLAGMVSLDGDLALEDIRTATDGTRKVTYRLKNGGGIVESVIIPSNTPDGRTTVCVSSQLGCAMNCQFCYTAKMGLRRNLSAAQIVEQVVSARRLTGGGLSPAAAAAAEAAGATREDLTNVVFMGMGEPLHNIEAVLAAVDILVDPKGLAFSRNKVTVSTSGLVPEMQRYLNESQGSLAVSLNATTDEIRSWCVNQLA